MANAIPRMQIPNRSGFVSSLSKIRYLFRVDWNHSVVAVIPCFNEARGIRALVEQVRKHVATVIVVDDGSNDSTSKEAVAGGAKVLRHGQNLGKGMALKTGLSAADDAGFRHAMLLDGDGQHAAQSIPAMFACLESTGAILVVGNRMQNAARMSWLRRRVNSWMSREISRLARRTMPDTQCGFRLVNLEVWRSLNLRTARFEVESEMIVRFAERGHRIEFVPIQTVPGVRPSYISPVSDTWRWFRWRWAVRSLASERDVHSPPKQNPSAVRR